MELAKLVKDKANLQNDINILINQFYDNNKSVDFYLDVFITEIVTEETKVNVTLSVSI